MIDTRAFLNQSKPSTQKRFPYSDLMNLSNLSNLMKVTSTYLFMITTGRIYVSPVLAFYIDVYFSFLLFHYQ